MAGVGEALVRWFLLQAGLVAENWLSLRHHCDRQSGGLLDSSSFCEVCPWLLQRAWHSVGPQGRAGAGRGSLSSLLSASPRARASRAPCGQQRLPVT